MRLQRFSTAICVTAALLVCVPLVVAQNEKKDNADDKPQAKKDADKKSKDDSNKDENKDKKNNKDAKKKDANKDSKDKDKKKKKADKKKTDKKKTDKKKSDKKKADKKKPDSKKKKKAEETSKNVEAVFLVSNLENPSGVAVQNSTGHVFIASRHGIYRYVPDDHSVHLEINTYPTDVYGKGTYETLTKFDIGPLGVAFMDDEHLVVGDGSREDGKELVRVYKISNTPAEPDKYIDEDKADFTLGPIPKSEQTQSGEGNFYGVAVGGGAIWVTCNGDDTKGWVAKAAIEDGKPGKLELSIATKVATNVDAPGPATFTPDGEQLVVGQKGEMNKPGDSLLTFYDPKSGKLLKKYETGVNDIAGLAYSPKTKKLYCTDFGWMDPVQKDPAKKVGGLYELVIEGDTVTTKKIISLNHPADITFDKDGKLYVTLFDFQNPEDEKQYGGDDKSAGGLYVIDAGL